MHGEHRAREYPDAAGRAAGDCGAGDRPTVRALSVDRSDGEDPLRRLRQRAAAAATGIDDDGLVEGFEGQLRQIFTNLDRLLADHDVRADQIAKTTVFLVDMADYAAMNELYAGYFGEHRPARSAIAVAELPFAARVELEAWAYLGD